MRRLLDEGCLDAEGKTSARRYALKSLSEAAHEIPISKWTEEDVVWRFRILPNVVDLGQDIVNICQYGFTEMLNNVTDHSGGTTAWIYYEQNYARVKLGVIDNGIGIFERLQQDFGLSDARQALLELSKGRITSNVNRHSGEGIFFTSRMFNEFSILSGNLFYVRTREGADEWLIETEDREDNTKGTSIGMEISTNADWTTRDVFESFGTDVVGFRKTHVPIKLGKYPGEQLVSRSQAKRILARFDDFSEVLLDFKDVPEIGQAFADEIFRVFGIAHPNITLMAINESPHVAKAIASAAYRASSPKPAS